MKQECWEKLVYKKCGELLKNCFVTRSPIPIWIWNLKWIACLLAHIPLWIWDFRYIICWQGPPFLSESECEMNCLLTGSPIPHRIWNVKWMVCWQGPYSHLNFEINYLPFALCAHYPLLSVFELLLFVDRNPCFLLIRSAVWNSYLIRIEIRISYPLFWIS